jgi:hypothetical protein
MDARETRYPQRPSRDPKKQIGDVVEFVEFSNLHRSDLRLIFYRGYDKKGEPLRIQERTGEHVGQLLLVAMFVIDYFHLSLDFGKVAAYITVHDLPETYAEGRDTPAFANPHDPSLPARADKERRERESQRKIAKQWGHRAPTVVGMMARYELQSDEESCFVCALDKFVSEVNIFLDEGYTNHFLEVTPEEVHTYKSKRVAVHEDVARWYRWFWEHFYTAHPEYFYKPARPALVPAE